MLRWTLFLAVSLVSLHGFGQEKPVYGLRPDGQQVTALAGPGTKAVVLYFVATDCPVSSRTFPEMVRVREKFAGRGVSFWFVYPDAGEQSEQVRLHQADYDAHGEAVLDTSGVLVALTGAHVTPEVSVLVPQGLGWRPVYTGRVDDRYVHIGLERPRATEHFAERVLTSVLNGTPVERATGTPVGCAIISPAAQGSSAR